jgi:hypothetical protein
MIINVRTISNGLDLEQIVIMGQGIELCVQSIQQIGHLFWLQVR